MSEDPEHFHAGRPLQHVQVKIAFLADEENPARPATLDSVDGDRVSLRWLDGSTGGVTVTDAARLSAVLERDDLCRLRGEPLLLVSTVHHVLGLATGPPTPPARLEVLVVSVVEDGEVVELLSHGDQPGWQLLALDPDAMAETTRQLLDG